MNQSDEEEQDEVPPTTEPPIEDSDDIIREISRRRLLAEFSEDIPAERISSLIKSPDQIEKPDEFDDEAEAQGLKPAETILGWSTDLETPAHIRRGDVPREIATMMHEDLHRMTDPETLREMSAIPAMNELYEGITEYLAEKAVSDLNGHVSGECYPEQVELAKSVAAEAGDQSLRNYYFRHELTAELKRALDRHAER